MKKPGKGKKFRISSRRQFDVVRRFFPYSCVDIILPYKDRILLTKRTIPPYKGKWHFPGGIIRKNEKMVDAVKRIGRSELNLNIKVNEFFGTYENLNRYRHDITHCFISSVKNDKIKNDFQSSKIKFFKIPPKNMIPYHAQIMREVKVYLKRL